MNNPFRYTPDSRVLAAADEVMQHISGNLALEPLFAPGKMLGVLLVEVPEGVSAVDACLHRLELTGRGRELSSLAPDSSLSDTASAGSRSLYYLAAFSGNVGDRNLIEGFVPPIYDLLNPDGAFKKREAAISAINREVEALENDKDYLTLLERREELMAERDEALEKMRAEMAASKARREVLRQDLLGNPPASDMVPGDGESDGKSDEEKLAAKLAELVRESQHQKAELRRMKAGFAERLKLLDEAVALHQDQVRVLKERRARESDALQRWIFEQFVVLNALGERRPVWDIFRDRGQVPPGGTGECAAPKLLQYAYLHGFKPMLMGEFWYGRSPAGSVRQEGHFYPSCSSKCGVLLPFMMRGLEVEKDTGFQAEVVDGKLCSVGAYGDLPGGDIPATFVQQEELERRIVFEDDWLLVFDKPGGMPSVPGLDGRISALEWLQQRCPDLESVHRLDMDTKGLLVFAKSFEVAVAMRRQFEGRQVKKVYRAVLSESVPALSSMDSSTIDIPDTGTASVKNYHSRGCSLSFESLVVGDKGLVSLPLAPDYEDRPRQKVDFVHGKEAHTSFEVLEVLPDGGVVVEFRPLEGRTHQLRVHSAHVSGLGRPIAGDLLYGGAGYVSSLFGAGLQLQAFSIAFVHPVTGEQMSFSL